MHAALQLLSRMADISQDSDKATTTTTMDAEKQPPRQLDAGKIDAALEFLGSAEAGTISEVDEKVLVRKIDWRIVPLMCKFFGLIRRGKSSRRLKRESSIQLHDRMQPLIWFF